MNKRTTIAAAITSTLIAATVLTGTATAATFPSITVTPSTTVAAGEPVNVTVTAVTRNRPVTIAWGDGSVSRLTSRCTLGHAGRPACTKAISHTYTTAGSVVLTVRIPKMPPAVTPITVTGETSTPIPPPVPEDPISATWQQDMLTQLNALRASVGRPPLEMCPTLTTLAQEQSEDMANRNYFDHVTPEGVSPVQRAEAKGYYFYSGENIAAGQHSVDEVMQDWKESPGHYANMISPMSTKVGFGMVKKPGSEWGTYWTQDFGYGPAPC